MCCSGNDFDDTTNSNIDDPAPPRDVTDQLSPQLRKEFAELRKYDARITTALADDAFAARFASDPRAALAELKIALPPVISHQLTRSRNQADLRGLTKPITFLLPTGQLVTTTPRVRITARVAER